MNVLNLSQNIVRLRRERKITQEELADFIGVTKASVSKWENQQSMPDIMLLPLLASFFGVTVDELMGYEPQMSKEQIRKCYSDLTSNFVHLPFAEAMEQVREVVRHYYSCYPLLVQICVLYLNHFMLAEHEEQQRELLLEAVKLCDRVLEQCTDMSLCSDAIGLKAMLMLQLGQTEEVIEMLEPVTDPNHISEQNDMVLIQAYQMAGRQEMAGSYNQIRLYLNLTNMISHAIYALSVYLKDLARCREMVRRTKGIIELFHIEELNPNLAAQFYYQTAVAFASNGETEEAMEALKSFEHCICSLMEKDRILLHGDSFFDRIDEWIERLPLGDQPPRDKAFVRQNVLAALENPCFQTVKKSEEFQKIYHRIKKGEFCYA